MSRYWTQRYAYDTRSDLINEKPSWLFRPWCEWPGDILPLEQQKSIWWNQNYLNTEDLVEV